MNHGLVVAVAVSCRGREVVCNRGNEREKESEKTVEKPEQKGRNYEGGGLAKIITKRKF